MSDDITSSSSSSSSSDDDNTELLATRRSASMARINFSSDDKHFFKFYKMLLRKSSRTSISNDDDVQNISSLLHEEDFSSYPLERLGSISAVHDLRSAQELVDRGVVDDVALAERFFQRVVFVRDTERWGNRRGSVWMPDAAAYSFVDAPSPLGRHDRVVLRAFAGNRGDERASHFEQEFVPFLLDVAPLCVNSVEMWVRMMARALYVDASVFQVEPRGQRLYGCLIGLQQRVRSDQAAWWWAGIANNVLSSAGELDLREVFATQAFRDAILGVSRYLRSPPALKAFASALNNTVHMSERGRRLFSRATRRATTTTAADGAAVEEAASGDDAENSVAACLCRLERFATTPGAAIALAQAAQNIALSDERDEFATPALCQLLQDLAVKFLDPARRRELRAEHERQEDERVRSFIAASAAAGHNEQQQPAAIKRTRFITRKTAEEVCFWCCSAVANCALGRPQRRFFGEQRLLERCLVPMITDETFIRSSATAERFVLAVHNLLVGDVDNQLKFGQNSVFMAGLCRLATRGVLVRSGTNKRREGNAETVRSSCQWYCNIFSLLGDAGRAHPRHQFVGANAHLLTDDAAAAFEALAPIALVHQSVRSIWAGGLYHLIARALPDQLLCLAHRQLFLDEMLAIEVTERGSAAAEQQLTEAHRIVRQVARMVAM